MALFRYVKACLSRDARYALHHRIKMENGRSGWGMEKNRYYAEKWMREGRKSLLDLECGFGENTKVFVDAGFWVTAADPDEKNVASLRRWEKQSGKILRSKQCRKEKLPFAADAFDCVWVSDTLLNADAMDFRQVLSEIKRVLKPDGVCFGIVNEEQRQIEEMSLDMEGFEILTEKPDDSGRYYIEAVLRKPGTQMDYSAVLGMEVKGKIDRPLGTWHQVYKDLYYPVNYGYVEGVLGGDGEEQDIYLLGEDKPVKEFSGIVVAVVHRLNDVEDKWVVDTKKRIYSEEEIRRKLEFQEKYFDSEIFVWNET